MPFADALTPLWARLRARYSQSPLPAFLHWWWGELRSMLPSNWQEQLRVQEAQILLHLQSDGLRVERVDGGLSELLEQRGADAGPLPVAEFVAMIGERAQRSARIALLPTSLVLVRRLSFPAAALANVRTLVGFEIDRQTPFRADQVEFDCRLHPVEAGAKSVSVDLCVVPKEAMARVLAPLSELGGQLDAIDVAGEGGRAGFNLLPTAQRRSIDQRPLLINLGLAALILLLLWLAMLQLVDNRVEAVTRISADVESQRSEARGTARLRKQLDDAVAGANFLAEQKAQRPSVVELLRVLTEILPDDTFVERLSFSGDTVSLTVQSASATKLMDLFQTSPHLSNPALAGPIQPDPRSGKDRATLTAQFGRPAAKEATP